MDYCKNNTQGSDYVTLEFDNVLGCQKNTVLFLQIELFGHSQEANTTFCFQHSCDLFTATFFFLFLLLSCDIFFFLLQNAQIIVFLATPPSLHKGNKAATSSSCKIKVLRMLEERGAGRAVRLPRSWAAALMWWVRLFLSFLRALMIQGKVQSRMMPVQVS